MLEDAMRINNGPIKQWTRNVEGTWQKVKDESP